MRNFTQPSASDSANFITFDHSLRKTFMSEYHSVKTKCSYLFVDSFDLVLALLNVTENLLKQCDNFYDISFHLIVQSWPMENRLVISEIFLQFQANRKVIRGHFEFSVQCFTIANCHFP